MSTRLLSLLMALSLVFSFSPIAFAVEDVSAASDSSLVQEDSEEEGSLSVPETDPADTAASDGAANGSVSSDTGAAQENDSQSADASGSSGTSDAAATPEKTQEETSQTEQTDTDAAASEGTAKEESTASSADSGETGAAAEESISCGESDPADTQSEQTVTSAVESEAEASGESAASSAESEELLDAESETTRTIEVALSSSDSGKKNAKKLRAAIAKANSKTHLIIKIKKKGTYKISWDLENRSNTTLDLNGSTLKRAGNVGNLIQNANLKGKQSSGKYSLSYDITIKNGTLDGSGGSKKMSNLVNIGHAQDITFENVTFRHAVGSHLLELAGCKNVLVKNCTFTGFKPTSDNREPAEAIQLDICAKGWNGVYKKDSTPCKNITITGCSFKDYPSGVGNHHSIKGHRNTNITITNNTFSNSKTFKRNGKKLLSPAIWFFDFTDSTISGNTITGKYSCGIKISAGNVKIKNNTFGSSKSSLSYPAIVEMSGGVLKSSSSSSRVSTKVSGGCIDSNVIYSKSSDNAISVKSGKLSSVSGNEIHSSKAYGVYLSGCTVTKINNNKVTSKAKEGIYLTKCKASTIDGNTVSSSSGSGISLNKSSKASSSINSNTISSCKKDGISIGSKCSASKVCSNTIQNCSGSGIYVASSGTVKTVQKNTITGCKKYGIQVLNAKLKSVTITENTLTSNKTAISVKSKNNKNDNLFQTV